VSDIILQSHDVVDAHKKKRVRKPAQPVHLAAVALVLDPRAAARHGKDKKKKKGADTTAVVDKPPQTPVIVVRSNPNRAHLISEQTPLAKTLKQAGKREYRFRILCILAYPNPDEHTEMTALVYAKMALLHADAYAGSASPPKSSLADT
jgi:hypothetical protein